MQRSRKSLSKNLLQMKFMQKSKERVEKELEEQNLVPAAGDLSETLKKEGDKYYVDPSFVFCAGLECVRLSFKGMNPEIERLMQEKEAGHSKKRPLEECAEVSVEEMARAMHTAKRRKYIRPVEDR